MENYLTRGKEIIMEYLLAIPYKQEILTFVLAFIALQILQYVGGEKNWIHKSVWFRQSIILILAVYFTGVSHYTLLHRDVNAGMEYELSLFWSYRYVIDNNSMVFLKEVFYNVILLMPMGLLIPFYMKIFHKLRITVVSGFFASCFIEICQLIFHLGLFELDDIFNNTLGAYMGYTIYYFISYAFIKIRGKHWTFKECLMIITDVCIIVYFYGLWNAIG